MTDKNPYSPYSQTQVFAGAKDCSLVDIEKSLDCAERG
jgi:hypothetical protein